MQTIRLFTLCAVGSFVCNTTLAMPVLTPFINELHYDNSGPDTNEFVEIAGAAQSLAGYSIALYNGGNGTRYRSVSLDGDIPDQDDGFGAIAFFIDGLQNGPADGIALIDALDQVLDWISYEGQVLAVNGPAAGLFSDPLPVEETGVSAVGSSLQRIGVGSIGADFGWAGPLPHSAGAINVGQQFLATARVSEPEPTLLMAFGLALLLAARQANARD